jgi:16S rRNA (guanine527-N7)-methyltransferase
MLDQNLELLVDGLRTLGLELPPERLQRVVGYHDLLMATNEKFNLTGFKEERESVIYNVLNALAPWKHVDALLPTADIGTGGGLPGLPLAIALDMPAMTLVESKRKKTDFLLEATGKFAPRVIVKQADANQMKGSFRQMFSSAFGTLEKLLGATASIRASGCRTLAWKGRREVIDQEIAACKPRDQGWEVVPFAVPHMPDTQRHLCIHVTKAVRRSAKASRSRA